MNRLVAALAAFMSLVLVACSTFEEGTSNTPDTSGAGPSGNADLTIVAATELKDLEELVDRAAEELGFTIDMQFPGGTLENSQTLKQGGFDGEVDATWFATNRYVNLIGASDKLDGETKIATSPVAFGVWEDSAKRLGWDTKQPTWAEFADAAASGKFTFGMTNPQASNSGFSALVSVATALADTGDAISPTDLERVGPQLKELFEAQSMVSGSSGWLAETFVNDSSRGDGIINYEATLHQLKAQGVPIEVVVPADGVISADYPLSALANPAHADARGRVEELSRWLLEHQEDIAQTYRRPVTGVDNVPVEIANQHVIELPFPANEGVVDELLYAYDNSYRKPGRTTFVLDTSGSMEGQRLASLKSIMHSLIDGSASTLTGDVSLRDRETVTLQAFDFAPHEPLTVRFSREDPKSAEKLSDFVDGLQAEGGTAVYETLLKALRNTDPNGGIPSIVLLSDGESTVAPDYVEFKRQYEALPEQLRNVPVFVILYGDANAIEMQALADLTGGEVFDALGGDLAAAFKEIRGFQ